MMPRSSDYASRPYAIGYCKPPRAHQWPKGTSGNPRGLTKRSGDIAACLCKLLGQSKPPRSKRVSFGDAISRKLLQQALNGDRLSIREVIRLQQEYLEQHRAEESLEITAELIFDEEENRYLATFQENQRLKKEMNDLKALFGEERLLLAPPAGS
jgi:hypothetical protein